jgi:hypothetical protein
MTQAQAMRLSLLEKIAVLQDTKKLRKLTAFVEKEIEETPKFPSDEVLLARAHAGAARIAAGHFVTWDQLEVSLEEAHQKGLSLRKLDGKANN